MTLSESLTPNELRNQEFRRSMRGFDPVEVAAVLEEAADCWEKAVAESLHWQEKYAALEDQVKKYTDMEKTLQDTLVVARKTAEEQSSTARKEAALIITEARQQAERIVHEANVQAESARQDLRELDQLKLRSKAELETALTALLAQLEQFQPDQGRATPSSKPEPELPPGHPAPPRTPDAPGESSAAPQTGQQSSEEYVDVNIHEPEKQTDDFDVALNKIFGGDKPDEPAKDADTKPE